MLFVIGHCLLFVVICVFLLFVVCCCLLFVVVCHLSLFVICCCLSFVVVCHLSLFVICCCLLLVIGYCLGTRGGRSFFIDSGLKMIHFKIQVKTKCKIFIKKIFIQLCTKNSIELLIQKNFRDNIKLKLCAKRVLTVKE